MKKMLLGTAVAALFSGVMTQTVQAQTTTTTTTTTTPPPTFDTRTKELRIPCLEVKGVVVKGSVVEDAKYDVVMKQRGQSSNWEITFATPGCAGEMPPADPVTTTTTTTTTK